MVWAQIVGEGHAQLFAQLFAQMYPLVQACERLADAKHGQKAVLDALLHSEFNPAQQDLLVNQFFRIVEKYLGPAQQAIIEMISAMRESQIPEKITSERKVWQCLSFCRPRESGDPEHLEKTRFPPARE
jgi:hypothetical protein